MARGSLVDAVESLGWAARSPEFRSVAYSQMAVVELRLNNKELAEHYANLALDYNRYCFNAMEVLAVSYRRSGETALADKYINSISQLDQLNHFADYERSLRILPLRTTLNLPLPLKMKCLTRLTWS
ncbi:MAG: hypothetical protein IPJ37_13585 [Bacteroidales bacterium]|nr:hypothetical protein [Bacteroidales bacterium]